MKATIKFLCGILINRGGVDIIICIINGNIVQENQIQQPTEEQKEKYQYF